VLVYVWALLRAQQVRKAYTSPFISIVVIAYNEERYIKQRIENILSLDYPNMRMN